MADTTPTGLSKYLTSTTDTLTADNYGEVDALVLAKLSYYRFEDIGISSSDSYTVSQYADKLLQSGNINDADEISFLENLRVSNRFGDCTVSNMQAENDTSQWAAITVNMTGKDSNTSVIAMRGTDGTTKGWHEDFEMLYDTDGTEAQLLSQRYLNNCDSERIFMAGHSKGGNDCTSAYIMSDEGVRSRVEQIHNFDGPGVNDTIKNDHLEAYQELDGKLNNYYPKDSIIGHLLNNNPGKTTFVQSDIRERYKNVSVFGEHDPMAFDTDGNGFLPAEQSALSKYVDQILDRTVEDLTLEEKENLIRFLDKYGIFSMIAGDKNPFSDTKKNVRDYLENLDKLNIVPDGVMNGMTDVTAFVANIIIAAEIYKNMSQEEKDAVGNAIQSILFHTAEKVAEDVCKKVEEIKNKVVDKYNQIADWCKDRYEDVRNTIHDVNKKIHEKIDSTIQKWNDFGNDIINHITHHVENVGYYLFGSADFMVMPASLRQAGADLRIISERIESCGNQVSSIMNNLQSSSVFLGVIAQVKGGSTKLQLNDLARKCNRMGEGLSQISSRYTQAEGKIASG